MKINWNKIRTGCGLATNIPKAIEKLFSKEEVERVKANNFIDNTVVIQSDLYEASFYVIDPIVQKLLEPYTVDRYYALEVLVEIILGGNGDEFFNFPFGEELFYLPLEDAIKRKFIELKEKIEKVEVITEREIEDKNLIIEKIGNWE